MCASCLLEAQRANDLAACHLAIYGAERVDDVETLLAAAEMWASLAVAHGVPAGRRGRGAAATAGAHDAR